MRAGPTGRDGGNALWPGAQISLELSDGNAVCGIEVRTGKGQEMNTMIVSVKEFLVSEDGPTAVEYAVMLALIIVVCIGTVTTIGTKANAKFQSTASKL